MQVTVPLPPPSVAPASAYASTSASPSGAASFQDVSSATVKVGADVEAGSLCASSDEDHGFEYSTFYFFVGFFAAALLLPFAFLFLLCPESTALVGRRRSAFIWGSAVGLFAGVGVVAVHFFVGYGIFVAWWMSKYDYI